jgi:DUF2958 family protein
MKLFTKAILTKLAKNGLATRAAQQAGENEPDHKPVLKIFNPAGAATWLITESDPDNPDCLFGLCDLGMGSPELGSVLASELSSVRGRFGLPLERDLWFSADKPLSQYADAARKAGRLEA